MSRVKTLFLSVLALCLSTILVVGATYALFTDNAEVNNHLQAGNLEIGLFQIRYQENTLNEEGVMVESKVNKDRINLRKDANSIFNIENAAPTSWYEASFELTNEGTVAFDYGIKLLWNTKNDASPLQIKFAEQIQITITSDEIENDAKQLSFKLSECANDEIAIGEMLTTTKAKTFTIKAEFIDSENNNEVMLISLDFDIQVYATQKISK